LHPLLSVFFFIPVSHPSPELCCRKIQHFYNNLRRDLKNLIIGEQAGAYLDAEINRLYQVIEEAVGSLAANGGYLGHDIYGNLPQTSW
jgi:hypothetical protein